MRKLLTLPIDVYAAAYMSISALSEQSIQRGGAPVDIPDFTHGKWMCRNDIRDLWYGLDRPVPVEALYPNEFRLASRG